MMCNLLLRGWHIDIYAQTILKVYSYLFRFLNHRSTTQVQRDLLAQDASSLIVRSTFVRGYMLLLISLLKDVS